MSAGSMDARTYNLRLFLLRAYGEAELWLSASHPYFYGRYRREAENQWAQLQSVLKLRQWPRVKR